MVVARQSQTPLQASARASAWESPEDARWGFIARAAMEEFYRRHADPHVVEGRWIGSGLFYPTSPAEFQWCCWSVEQRSMWQHTHSLFHVSNLFNIPYRILIGQHTLNTCPDRYDRAVATFRAKRRLTLVS